MVYTTYMTDFKPMKVRVATYNKLDRLLRGKESFSDVIDRLVKDHLQLKSIL